jgi:ribonucleoside-triphosphate reductase
MRNFPFYKIDTSNDVSKIIGTFDQIKFLISKFGNEQSGGMAFANFDQELYDIFKQLKIKRVDKNKEILRECIKSFI